MNALKIGMQKSGFRGHEDTMKLIEALEGLEMREGDDFPQGDKTMRKEDHQRSSASSSSTSRTASTTIIETIAKEKTIVPPACKFV